jgi:hypothetical protein
MLLGAGVPMAVVQKVLRLADPRITSERYAHFEQDSLGTKMRKLSLLLASTRNQHKSQTKLTGLEWRLRKPSHSQAF